MKTSPGIQVVYGQDEAHYQLTKDIDVSLEGSRFVAVSLLILHVTQATISSRCVLASGQEWVIRFFISRRVRFHTDHLALTSAASKAVAISQERLRATPVDHGSIENAQSASM